MKKRLIIVIWNMGIGGIQKRMRDIVLDIARHKKDWEVFFLIRRRGESQFIESLQAKKYIHLIYYPHQGIRFPLGFIAWTAWQYLRLRPTITLTFLAQLTIVMAFIRKAIFWHTTKFVVNEGAFVSGYLKFNALRYLHLPLRWAYHSLDSLIVPTEACKSDLVKSFGVKPERIRVIPNWTLLSPTESKKDRYDILFIGRFEREKNPLATVHLVGRLLSSYPELRAGIAGDGTMKQELITHIREKQLDYHIDVLPPWSAREALGRSRVLIVPSFNEGMPNVVLEAAMYQVPTVALNFPGATEVIKDGSTGYITCDLQSMTEAVERLLKNPRLAISMGHMAQKYVIQHFSQKNQKQFINMLLGD